LVCHVDEEAAFSGDSVARAVAADALGRSDGPVDAAARARRLGALLEVMAGDRYPAIRHIAWRAARRLGAPADDYDPSAPARDRAAAVDRLRVALETRAVAPDPARVARLRAASPEDDVEIGE
jgi:hypothetical protein